MKILILRHPPDSPLYPGGLKGGACYLTDMLLHGLRKKFGDEVVEYERSWWMYYEDWGPGKKYNHEEYGHKTFTIYKTLHNDDGVDRDDIESKIKNRYYDLIVFGYTHYGLRPDSWDLVTEYYPANKIAYIDGGDLWSNLRPDLVNKCVYFKRELYTPQKGLYPINFAIPEEKIGTIYREKINALAPMNPHNPSSYVYEDEREYYQQYAESLFGITTKKNGWDCLRHYEIMANNCIPLFLDIEQCPEMIMTSLPKDLIIRALKLVQSKDYEYFTTDQGTAEWFDLNDKIQLHFRKYCTTESLANHFLNVMTSSI